MWGHANGFFHPGVIGWPGWLIWLLIVAVLILAIMKLLASFGSGNSSHPDRDDSMRFARSRWARGEITEEEFLKIKQVLGN